MTQHKNEPERTTTDSQGKQNPYDDAKPIRPPRRASHRPENRKPAQTSRRVRSRSVQSARDSAHRRSVRPREADNGDATESTGSIQKPRPVPRTSRSKQDPKRTAGKRRPTSRARKPDGLRTMRRRGFGILVAALLLGICALGALLFWINRPVPVTVNGKAVDIRVGSTLQEVISGQGLSIKAGDYVSVSGNVLESEGGRPFSAAVNGRDLNDEEVSSYRVAGTEAIDITDGTDIIEDYSATAVPIAPKLSVEGEGNTLQYISQWGRNGSLETRTGNKSGETADVVAEEPQDCVVTRTDLILKGDRKLVALTFNDGPADPYTNQLLDICKEKNVHATFFCLTENVKEYSDVMQRIKNEGHQLGFQTASYVELPDEDAETVRSEIEGGAQVVEQATGIRPTHLRPPAGTFTEQNWIDSNGSVSAIVRWSADTQDWSLPGTEAIVANAVDAAHSGSVILMSDGGGDRSQGVEALPQIIDSLQANGYSFVTISELLSAVNNVPEEVRSGTQAPPEWSAWPTQFAEE